ncbi:MAG: hypothetical protein N2444_09355, partial [Methylocystis sp.]|nr:hypothetical protein [Methylocystis sp.]
ARQFRDRFKFYFRCTQMETLMSVPKHIDWSEAGLRWTGVALASGSLAFAAFMMQGEREPGITGQEHLAIYAKPATLAAQRLARRDAGVDYRPTGSIEKSVETRRPRNIIDATPYAALLGAPFGFKLVTVGDEVPGYGRVTKIDHADGKWRVATQRGVIWER